MNEYQLYSNMYNKKTYLAIWGASTKHPDCVFCLEHLINSEQFKFSDYCTFERNLFQFILYCASRLNFDFNAYSLVSYAMQIEEEYFNSLLRS